MHNNLQKLANSIYRLTIDYIFINSLMDLNRTSIHLNLLILLLLTLYTHKLQLCTMSGTLDLNLGNFITPKGAIKFLSLRFPQG